MRRTSSSDRPYRPARNRMTWTTWAGSFTWPRTGTGAQYGESVSTSSRSSGVMRADSRTSGAFGNVTMPEYET